MIKEATIVCGTLAVSGQNRLLDLLDGEIDYLIVDEACQAIEPLTLIPMQMNAPRVILVGDHRQLAATVHYREGIKQGLSRSLFERLVDNKVNTHMLTIQYRMDPQISAFPSKEFYDGLLIDHNSVKIRPLPDHLKEFEQNLNGRRVLFVDIPGSREHTDATRSKSNQLEIAATRGICELLGEAYNFDSVGVITPYKSQRIALKDEFGEEIEVNTVDSFQGREKEILLFNCVRTKGLGFLTDERRLNVAITRPKYFLIIIGNSNCLEDCPVWYRLIQHCKNQNNYRVF